MLDVGGVVTPITDRAIAWCRSVVSGETPACQRVVLACKRFERDLDRQGTEDFPYVFDPIAAEHLCSFVECMPHIKGKLAREGKTLTLLGWQAFILAQINGWREVETGLRRFRTVYAEVPRKNGKSTLVAPVGLYCLTVDGETGPEVYSAASSSETAKIVFDAARIMAQKAQFGPSMLASELGLKIETHKIRRLDDDAAIFRAVAAQTKSHDGKGPHCALIDELHEHQNRDVWDSMENGMGGREQPIMFAITTAGTNTAGICYEQRRYVERILEGVLQDETILGIIFAADDGDDPGDPDTWARVNPSLGAAKTVASMQALWRKAQSSPGALGEFLRKHLNIWTAVGSQALDMQAWRASAQSGAQLEDFTGRKAYIGVDLATRLDPASVVLNIPDEDKYHVFSWHFLPEKIVQADGNEHLFGWTEKELIRTTPGAELDLNIVETLVLQLAGLGDGTYGWDGLPEFDVEAVVYDAMYAAQMAATWEAEGMTAIELRSRASNLNEPFNKLIAAVDDRQILHDDNDVLTWMAGNTLEKKVQGGDFIYPGKAHPEEKIDGIIALTNTFYPLCALLEEKPKKGIIHKGYIDV